MSAKDTAILGAVVVGGFLLWKLFQKGKEFVESGADLIARPIAYTISALILPAAVHVNGGAVLPDGGYVSFDAILNAGSKVDSHQEFSWRGVRYRLVKRRPDGNYDAIRI